MAYYPINTDLSYDPFTPDDVEGWFRVYYLGVEPFATQCRDLIIKGHLKLAAKLAIGYSKRLLRDDDAISAGNAGLMQAVTNKRFDPDRGLRFSTYLVGFVRGRVLQSIRLAVSVPIDDCDGSGGGFGPDSTVTGSLSEYTGLPVYAQPRRRLEPTVEHAYEAEELLTSRRTALDQAIARLIGLEKISVQRVSLRGQSYQAVADSRGCSRQAVQQAHVKALKKLRHSLSSLRSELL